MTSRLRPAFIALALLGGLLAFAPSAAADQSNPPNANITGNVATWGDSDPSNDVSAYNSDNYYGQQDIPASLASKTVTAVAASQDNSMALDSDGKVYVWGYAGNPDNGWSTVPPAALASKRVVAIDTGTDTMMALAEDGVVTTWGSAANPGGHYEVPGALSGKIVTAIAAGGAELALTNEDGGKVYAWGTNTWGESTVPPAAQSNVVAIAADRVSSLALKDDGSIVTWGSTFGTIPTPDSGHHFVDIAAGGDNRYAALDDTGKVYTWGYAIPVTPPSLVGKRVVSIDVGGNNMFAAVTDQGEVVTWGYDNASPSRAAYLPANLAAHPARQVAVGAVHLVAALVPPVANTSVPTISGALKVGETLTATPGAWAPSDATLTYQWSGEGHPISGATSSAYTLTSNELYEHVTVTVTASRAGYLDGSATSASTSPIAQGTVTNTAAPAITGTPKVGQTLATTGGAWEPSSLNKIFRWKRNGEVIATAESNTYTLTSADLGKAVTVEVRAGGLAGYSWSDWTSSAPTALVTLPDLVNTAAPAITGTAQVGRILTASPGSWNVSGATVTLTWKRNGTPVKTGRTYTLAPADLGAVMTVTAKATKSGYNPSLIATSKPTAKIAKGRMTAPLPKITGIVKVGKVLTAVLGRSTPTAGSIKIQWLRNGVPIRNATKAAYRLVKADGGQRIRVRVTRIKPGYLNLVLTSNFVTIRR